MKPRLAFIKNFDAIENIPEVRALYLTESEGLKSEDGHPDFEFSRRKFAELDIEEKRRNELIKQALDRMNERYRERKESQSRIERVSAEIQNTFITDRETTTTFGNIFKYRFSVPADVYSDEEYGKKLDQAKTVSEVESIIRDYHEHHKTRAHSPYKYIEPEGKTEPNEKIEPSQSPSARRHFPVGKAVGLLLAVGIIGALLWYSPNIISMIQNYSSGSSYSQITVSIYNSTSLQFGGIDYFFQMGFTQQYQGIGYLSVWDSLVESKGYNITEGAIYRDFGIEMKVKELHPDYAVLLVKATVQNYLAESGFTKLTIAEGQMQNLTFGSNMYTVAYSQAHLYVTTPLFQYRDYLLTSVPTTIHSDLGLEIRVSNIAIGHVVVFVKPTY
jgi:hypothetical protein